MSPSTFRIIMLVIIGIIIVFALYNIVRMFIFKKRGISDKAENCLKAVILYSAAGVIIGIVSIIISHILGG